MPCPMLVIMRVIELHDLPSELLSFPYHPIRHNGKLLKCLSLHDAYPRKAREETAELDVQFAPSVSLERNAEDVYDLEADKDSLSIR